MALAPFYDMGQKNPASFLMQTSLTAFRYNSQRLEITQGLYERRKNARTPANVDE